MLALFFTWAYSQLYPLLLGVGPDVIADTPSSLAAPGVLPDNMTVFIAIPTDEMPLNDIAQLSKWGGASEICAKVGKVLAFPAVDSNTFHFLKVIRERYSEELKIDAANECACKIRYFKGGLITVRVSDEDIEAVDEVVAKLPPGTAIAFTVGIPDLLEL
jgi:hypothetical protein